jgi:hypothetical protein
VGITAYLLFFLAGLGFGYAAPARWRWLPLLFPLALALGAVMNHGLDGAIVVRFIIALIVTVLGILAGSLIDSRATARSDHARYA